MEAGLSVPLDPLGGNQLNVRELLRLLQPALLAAPDDADDTGMEDGLPSGAPAEREPEPVGRRSALDDYDYDDDFIDDAEVFEEEHGAPALEEEYDESADEDFLPDDKAASESDDDPAAEGPGGTTAPPKTVATVVHHGFGQFFVNKGNIPSKVKLKAVNPPSKLGNVSLEHIKFPATAGQYSTPGGSGAGASSGDEVAKKTGNTTPKKQQVKIGDGPASQPAKKKGTEGTPSGGTQNAAVRTAAVKVKPIPETVLAEIAKLQQICQEEFGDKKPKLNDPKLQEQLHVLFKTAMATGVARLFSDIAKDKRIVSLNDDVWVRLSRFLRTKRANLEQLGHALHWSAREKSAKTRVGKTEGMVDSLLKMQLETAVVIPGETNGGKRVDWTRELDEKLYDWYRSKCDLQLAKNQLASRVKSIKKSMPAWVTTIRGKSFAGFVVAEQDIIDSFRRIEEEKLKEDRQKREADRQERKRKKEEWQAGVAAKRAATAQAKSLAAASAAAAAQGAAGAGGGGAGGGTAGGGTPKTPGKNVKIGAKPVIVKPGTPKVGMPKPGNGKAGTPKLGTPKSGMGKAGSGKVVVGKSANGKGNGGKGGVVKGSGTKSSIVKIGTAKPVGTVKMTTPGKGGKNGVSGGTGVVGGPKQVKLTTMMKKTMNVESGVERVLGVGGGEEGCKFNNRMVGKGGNVSKTTTGMKIVGRKMGKGAGGKVRSNKVTGNKNGGGKVNVIKTGIVKVSSKTVVTSGENGQGTGKKKSTEEKRKSIGSAGIEGSKTDVVGEVKGIKQGNNGKREGEKGFEVIELD